MWLVVDEYLVRATTKRRSGGGVQFEVADLTRHWNPLTTAIGPEKAVFVSTK